ncbi:helix-turn-helix domain-containing protein [Amycolatopsis sp. TNS106]|uniref:helix-turn-helix domain-containing protein n=1 Tax=Amycolatopsis sp. TNS106 TaxID=2861750 RepID=UPI0021069CB8|nr:helix-turn-helix domain-containing protein [Amycolatopsis sp. TNS106]
MVVSAMTGTVPSMLLRRTPAIVARADTEEVRLSFSVESRSIQIGKNEVVLRPGDWSVADSALLYDIPAAGGTHTETSIGLPYSRIPVRQSRIERLVGRPLDGKSGYGALLAQVLTQIVRDAASYRPEDSSQLETTVLDLVIALCCRALDGGSSVPAESRRRNLVLRIRTFVRENLNDPALTPGTIAAAHHISRSHLHNLFKDQEETVAAWIRRQRLERAAHDLADPALLDTPVHAIAARWGFSRPADFTRAFRADRGVTPREHRLRHFFPPGQPSGTTG